MDEYDSNMDKDPFKGAGIGKGDTDKQAVTELTIWPQASACSEAGIPLRGVSDNALTGRNQATGLAGSHD